jgi:hypothetical protein
MHSMKTARRFPVRILVVIPVAWLLLLGGCEAVFTYSPFTGLQRDPSNFTPEQRLSYAEDALASGDLGAMQAALDAIKADTSHAAVYTSAKLEIELSGLPTLGLDINDTTNLDSVAGASTTVGEFLTAHPGLQPSMLVDAGARLQSLEGVAPLSDSDRVIGAIGLALAAAAETDPIYDFQKVHLTAALEFLAPVATPGSAAEQVYNYLSSHQLP